MPRGIADHRLRGKAHTMTYPPPRYLGDKGENTAVYRPAGHEPELTYSKTGNAALGGLGGPGRPSEEELAKFFIRHDTYWL